MSFFQNPMDREFRGFLAGGGDRQYSLTFSIPANKNKSEFQESWNFEPYDFSTYSTLTINYAYDPALRNFSALSINVAGATASATLAREVVDALNANSTFADLYVAQVRNINGKNKVFFRSTNSKASIRTYITNAGAEQLLRFNRYASVAELPSYMERHTIDNRFVYPDSEGMLVLLDESDTTVDRPIITEADLDYSAMQADWQLLRGRDLTYLFHVYSYDGSGRIEYELEYPAGALAGDLARQTHYTYTGAATVPDTKTTIPYVLESSDILTSP